MRAFLTTPVIICCANFCLAQGNITSHGNCNINITGGNVKNLNIVCPHEYKNRQPDVPEPRYQIPEIPKVCQTGEKIVSIKKTSFKTVPDGRNLIVNPGDMFTSVLWAGSTCIVEYCTRNAGGSCFQGIVSIKDIILQEKAEAAYNKCKVRNARDDDMKRCFLSEIRH